MPERNFTRYGFSLTALVVASSITDFLALIQEKMDLLGILLDAFQPCLTSPPWKMFFVFLISNSVTSFAVVLSGIFFGLVSMIAVASNGYILGESVYNCSS
jgi:uncharacterized membrane protein SpoIIM required for sporulation